MENACQNVRIKKLCKKIKVISVFGKIQFVMNMTKLTKENVVFVDKWIMIYFWQVLVSVLDHVPQISLVQRRIGNVFPNASPTVKYVRMILNAFYAIQDLSLIQIYVWRTAQQGHFLMLFNVLNARPIVKIVILLGTAYHGKFSHQKAVQLYQVIVTNVS